MITFKKQDPITNLINRSYFKLSQLPTSIESLEGLLKTNENNPLELTAIGFYYIHAHPFKVRGYLSAYDNLYKLGFDGDSFTVLNQCIKAIGHHPLVVARLVNRYMVMRDYSSICKLLKLCDEGTLENLRTNHGLITSIVDLSKITKNTTAYDTLKLRIPEIDTLKTELLESNKKHAKQNITPSELYLNYKIKEEFSTAEEYSWLAYAAGERSEAFFDAICEPLPTELDISSRVMFFRIEASRAYNKNPKFIAYGARTFLHSGEVEFAHKLTSNSIENSVSNNEILHLNARTTVILGCSEPPLEPLSQSNESDQLFYNYRLHRKFCKSVLSEHSDDELHYRTLSQSNGLTLHSPLSVTVQKTPIQKSDSPRVAICISGQLRGIEKSSQRIISDIANRVSGHIFIDTWKTQVSSFPTFTRVPRLIGAKLSDLLPTELRMPDGFRKYLPLTTKKLTAPIVREITPQYVNKFFPQATVRIEDETLFETFISTHAPGLTLRGNLNQAKMFYKIKKCQELVDTQISNNEHGFDVIIRTRPDLEINIPNIKDYVDTAFQNPNILYVSYITALGYGDQFAIGSKRTMDIYASIWEKIWKHKLFNYSNSFDPKVSSFAGEALTANHLLFHGIDVRLIKPEKSNFTTTLSINSTSIKDELEADINASALKQSLKPFQSKYLEMINSDTTFT